MPLWRWREAGLLYMAFQQPFGHAIVGSSVLLVLLAVELIAGEPPWRRAAGDGALAALVGAAVLSAALSPWRAVALPAAAGFALGAFVVTRATRLAAVQNPRALAWVLGAWATAGVFAATWGVMRLGAGLDARAEIPGLGYNHLGTTLATASALLLGFTLHGPRPRRLAAFCGLAIVIVGLALTFSRGAWLGAAAGILVLAWAGQIRRLVPAVIAIVVVSAIVVAVLAPRWAWHVDRLGNVLVTEGPFSRIAIWRAVPGMVAARPVTGWGFATFLWAHRAHPPTAQMSEHPPYAHNLILNFAVETGLVGVAALLAFLVAGIGSGVRWYQRTIPGSAERALSATVLAAIMATLGTQMVDNTLTRLDLALGLFALLALASAQARGADAAVGA